VYVADKNNFVAAVSGQFVGEDFFCTENGVKGTIGSPSYEAYYKKETYAGNFEIRQLRGEKFTTKPDKAMK
jgi:hypothetical protein